MATEGVMEMSSPSDRTPAPSGASASQELGPIAAIVSNINISDVDRAKITVFDQKLRTWVVAASESKQQNNRLKSEIDALKAQLGQVQDENERLKEELSFSPEVSDTAGANAPVSLTETSIGPADSALAGLSPLPPCTTSFGVPGARYCVSAQTFHQLQQGMNIPWDAIRQESTARGVVVPTLGSVMASTVDSAASHPAVPVAVAAVGPSVAVAVTEKPTVVEVGANTPGKAVVEKRRAVKTTKKKSKSGCC